ncbi:MAG TPA: glycosidase, partial [Paenibacillus sp.]
MSRIIGDKLSNIPWQDKPDGYNAPVWRYTHNPIIQRDAQLNSNSIFNSAVIPFEEGYAGVFRCDS